MKKLSFVTLGLAVALSFLASCDDVEPIDRPYTEKTTSLESFMSDREAKSETFQFTAENGTTFTTKNGSIITIPANVFVTKAGASVTGPINFKVKEVFSNADIMFTGIFPVSNGDVLNSGGEFFLQAKSGSETLRVRNGDAINIVIPAQAEDNGMMLFFGGEDENPEELNWQVDEDSAQQGNDSTWWNRSGFTFNSADKTYEIDLDSMGWANIDAFNRDPNFKYFNCTFNLSGLSGLSNENTTAFAVFKDFNSVWPVGVKGWGDITNSIITEKHLGSVPMNLLIISVVDEQLYYGHMEFTPEEGKDYTIEMKTITKDALDTLIKSFE